MIEHRTPSLPGSSRRDSLNQQVGGSRPSGCLEKPVTDYLQSLKHRAAHPLADARDGVMFLHTRKGAMPYEIPLDELETESALIGWIYHLSEKKWFTSEKCEALILETYRHWGKEVPR